VICTFDAASLLAFKKKRFGGRLRFVLMNVRSLLMRSTTESFGLQKKHGIACWSKDKVVPDLALTITL